jgi:hypothetical protein
MFASPVILFLDAFSNPARQARVWPVRSVLSDKQ